MANIKFMDVTKWKKIEARAKRADKNLEKRCNQEEGDKDYDDDVYISDVWDWGTSWIDDWYDTVVENGIYDLNGEKVHILWKSPKIDDDDGQHEIINGLNQWGFPDEEFIQIDYSYSEFKAQKIDWCVVAVVGGIKKLIIPHRRGDFIPKDSSWNAWCEVASGDNDVVEYDEEMEDGVIASHDSLNYKSNPNVEYISWYKREYDYENSGYNIGWSNMRRIA